MNYTIYGADLECKKGLNGGWCVLEMPPEFYGVDDSLLLPFLINNDILIDLIKKSDNTEENNVELVLKITSSNGEYSECVDLCAKLPVLR